MESGVADAKNQLVTAPTAAGARGAVLFIHQGSELYGSDKVFLNLAIGVRAQGFLPLVVLPHEGPLHARLRDAGIECHLAPIGKIARANLSPWGLVRLLRELLALRDKAKFLGLKERIDLIYSNTIATTGGAMLAWLWRKPNIWHVHEIIQRPALFAAIFPRIVAFGSSSVISNSKATAEWLNSHSPALQQRNEVIWNGIGPTTASAPQTKAFRAQWGLAAGCLAVALVGRINHWKGHALALAAVAALPEAVRQHVVLLYVGNVFPGQEDFERELRQQIERSGIAQQVLLQPFVEDVDSLWEAIDIALVPSTEPEPFGLVAIEAMRAGKPVVASAHGGLTAIVEDGQTGFLVPPRDTQALAKAIEALVLDPQLCRRMGEAGRQRQAALFSLEAQVEATCRHMDRVLAQAKG